MKEPRPRAAKALAALLSPLLIASSLLRAVPVQAQVKTAPPTALSRAMPSSVGLAPAPLGPAPVEIPSALNIAPPLTALSPIELPAPVDAVAQESLAVAAESPSSPKSAVLSLAQAVSNGLSKTIGTFFDGGHASGEDFAPAFAQGVIAQPSEAHSLRPGVRLDPKPKRTGKGSVQVKDFHLAHDHLLGNGAAPIKLDADPTDPVAVEKALRALVDANPEKYGAPSSDMAKVNVQFVPGVKETGQADVYYAIFRQWKKGVEKDGKPYYLLVDGGSLAFVMKVFKDGKPTIMATEGRLYPGVSSDVMTVNFTEAELTALALKRLQSPLDAQPGRLKKFLLRVRDLARRVGRKKVAERPPVLLTREITNVNGAWHALNIYQASDLKGRPVIVAVDVNSGEAFAWGSQDLLKDGGPIASAATGEAFARGTTLSPSGSDHGPTGAMPLPYANVYDETGKVVAVTSEDGAFTVPGAAAATKLTIRLEGTYAKESDDASKKNGAVEATVTAAPGRTVRVTLNSTGDDVELAADVNGYVYYSKQVAWLKDAAGVKDERILAPLAGGVRANKTDMPGNAYYSPADDSLNLQAAAAVTVKDKKGLPHTLRFENTAQPSIIYHESTHRAVQILSQIELSAEQAASAAYRFVARAMSPVMDGGVNEAIADAVSMFMRGSPLIGEGFFAGAPPPGRDDLIRTGENSTQFDPENPDPHAQGEALMAFAWAVRQGLIEALGEAAGAAYAALLVVPTTLYSQPQDVPTAMLHVLIGSMTVEGNIPHEGLLRAAARAHGLTLPSMKP